MKRFPWAVALLPLIFFTTPASAAEPHHNGIVVAVDAAQGVVTASETATGRLFAFSVNNTTLLNALKPGMRFGARGAPGSPTFSLTGIADIRPDALEECCDMVGQARAREATEGEPVIQVMGKPPALGPQNAATAQRQPTEAEPHHGGLLGQAPTVGASALARRQLAPGVVLEITEFRRVNDKVLHLGFAIVNQTDKAVDPMRYGVLKLVGSGPTREATGLQLHDLENLKYYRAGNATEGRELDVAPNSRKEYWAQYKSPPRDVTALTVNFTEAPPLYNLPLQ